MQNDTASPLISVIIPTLNEEKLISSTLSQFTPEITNQFSIEIIVSDGGSHDKTVQLSEKYANKVIPPEQGKKQNISLGRNSGARCSAGTLLYFFNGDTRIGDIDEFFSTTLKAFKDENVIALTCKFKVFPEEERLSDRVFHTCYNAYVRLLNISGIGMGRGECQMIRRESFMKVKGYNELMAAGEDFDLYRRIRKVGKIRFLNEITIFESPRRYRKFGYWGVFVDWTRNSLSVFFRNKSLSKEWEEVR